MFLLEYFDITDSKKEQQVLCPFEHKTLNGQSYFETNPSASVNTEEGLFYCQSCGEGLNELQFIQKILGTDYVTAKRIQNQFNVIGETRYDWNTETRITDRINQICDSFGITTQTITQLQIRDPEIDDDA